MGWTFTTLGSGCWVLRNTGYDPDPDYEVCVNKNGPSGFAKLHQTIDVIITDLNFSVHTKLYAYDSKVGSWAAASVVLSYMNDFNTVLGETRICQKSAHCPWASSPTRHLIIAADTSWRDYSFNINDELTNLPGVDPLEISKIQVALFDTTRIC